MERKIIRILWTDPAKADLRRIYDFYALHSSDLANKMVRRIIERVSILFNGFPETGQRELLLQDKPGGYRYLVEGNYKIIYRSESQTIIINAVFDCRQNPQLLKDNF